MEFNKARLASLRIRFPLKFDQAYMYAVDAAQRPFVHIEGLGSIHGQWMIERGKFIVETLNQMALEAGLYEPKPIANQTAAQAHLESDVESVPSEPVEKEEPKRRGRPKRK